MKPEWVNQLKGARNPDRIGEGMLWCVVDSFGVDLGQFSDGKWFCGPCAGDSASEAIARCYMQTYKSHLDDIDGILRIRPTMVFMFGRDITDGPLSLLDWYATARRAELNSNP